MIVRRALSHEIAEIFNLEVCAPVVAYVAEDGEEIIGAGGLTFLDGPRCWMFFMADEKASNHPFTVVRVARELKKMARGLGYDEVFVTCDRRYETAPRLVNLLGFQTTTEIYEGLEVFKCQV